MQFFVKDFQCIASLENANKSCCVFDSKIIRDTQAQKSSFKK